MVKIRTSDKFERAIDKLDNSIKVQIEKLTLKIISDPELGKPMRFDRKGTREVYAGSFRLSYAYDKEKDTLYLLGIYHKDRQ